MNRLRWFPHDNDAGQDLLMRELVDRFGHVGHTIFWRLIEQIHLHGLGNTLRIRTSDLAHYCQTRSDKLLKVLDYLGQEVPKDPGNDPQKDPGMPAKIVGTWSREHVQIEMPKLRERLKKLKTKSSPIGPGSGPDGSMEGKGKEEQIVEGLLRSKFNGERSAQREAALMAQRMPFGRWKGAMIGNLEPGYCKWILTQSRMRASIRGTLRDALELRVELKEAEKAAA